MASNELLSNVVKTLERLNSKIKAIRGETSTSAAQFKSDENGVRKIIH